MDFILEFSNLQDTQHKLQLTQLTFVKKRQKRETFTFSLHKIICQKPFLFNQQIFWYWLEHQNITVKNLYWLPKLDNQNQTCGFPKFPLNFWYAQFIVYLFVQFVLKTVLTKLMRIELSNRFVDLVRDDLGVW